MLDAGAGTIKLYRQPEWIAYCAEQIKLHGGVCAHCLRPLGEVVLQVHHRDYVKGRMPWDYPYEECEVLCKGCHAKEHGIIQPSKDWELIGQDDLGGLDGECDWCGNELRYTHLVSHPKWGAMIVGAQCCDRLTESTIGSEGHLDFLNVVQRRKTFVKSPKWRALENGATSIDRGGFAICIITQDDGKFRIRLADVEGKAEYETLLDAKIFAFDFVETGQALAFFEDRRLKIERRLSENLN